VRYLRMLLNSGLAGALAAVYLAVLFLQLNPDVPLRPGTFGPLAAVLLLSYGVHFAVAFYVLSVLRQMIGEDALSPGWLSVRMLAWLAALAATGGAALMWLNLRGLRSSLDAQAAQRMALGAAVLTLCALACLVLALVRRTVQPARWRLGAGLLAVVLAVSVAGPLALRGAGSAPDPPGAGRDRGAGFQTPPVDVRVTMLLVDGASLDFVSPAAAAGRLPNFGRMLDAGSVMHLATLRPTQPAPAWTAVATGKRPSMNGVRSASTYGVGAAGPSLDLLPDYCLAHGLVYFGFLHETPHTSASVRARTLWDILGASGIGSGIVRWPLTYPAQPVRGILVSDQLHRTADPALRGTEPPVTHPTTFVTSLEARLDTFPVDDVAMAGLPDDVPYPGVGSLAVDRFYAEVFDHVRQAPDVQFTAMRYQGLDTMGHYFLRQATPRDFGDVSEDERRQFGRVLEQYYRYIDEELGRAINRMGPNELLIVVSAFGMEPVSMPKRALERVLGNPELSGTHERAPDGFLMALGPAVRPGRLPRASVLDVAPTVLYFFGLPIGRDMDGYARTDIFSQAFTEERPLTFIPTYER
jgi:predicted AlkP superfamily phosphohydrolase/phosphomutase